MRAVCSSPVKYICWRLLFTISWWKNAQSNECAIFSLWLLTEERVKGIEITSALAVMPDALTKFGIGEIFWTRSKNKRIRYTDICKNKMKILKLQVPILKLSSARKRTESFVFFPSPYILILNTFASSFLYRVFHFSHREILLS